MFPGPFSWERQARLLLRCCASVLCGHAVHSTWKEQEKEQGTGADLLRAPNPGGASEAILVHIALKKLGLLYEKQVISSPRDPGRGTSKQHWARDAVNIFPPLHSLLCCRDCLLTWAK